MRHITFNAILRRRRFIGAEARDDRSVRAANLCGCGGCFACRSARFVWRIRIHRLQNGQNFRRVAG